MKNKYFRHILMYISICLLVGILIFVVWINQTSGPHYDQITTPYNDQLQAAMDIRIDLSRNLFQIGLIFIGAIWGLIIAKKGEANLVFKDQPEYIMSVVSIILLLLSFCSHLYYTHLVTEIFLKASFFANSINEGNPEPIIDIFSIGINYIFIAQYSFLISGALISIGVVFSAHKLK